MLEVHVFEVSFIEITDNIVILQSLYYAICDRSINKSPGLKVDSHPTSTRVFLEGILVYNVKYFPDIILKQ